MLPQVKSRLSGLGDGLELDLHCLIVPSEGRSPASYPHIPQSLVWAS